MKYSVKDRLLLLQGIYFFITGFWPVLHIGSFMLVTGSKTDVWLVKTLGAVLGCAGAAFCVSAFMHEKPGAAVCLAYTSACVLAIIDVYYVVTGTIRPVYLADAAVEALFLAGWIMLFFTSSWKS